MRKELTREEYSKYFEMIQNKEHWKAPINAVIDATDFDNCWEACLYFTATDLYITKKLPGDKLRVKAVGYWNGPAGP